MKAEAWQKKREYTEVELDLALEILNDLKDGVVLNVAPTRPSQAGWRGIYSQACSGDRLPPDGGIGGLGGRRSLAQGDSDEADPDSLGRDHRHCADQVSSLPGGTAFFCPQEDQLPKSYLSEEPGAKRGVENNFDPFFQVHNRIKALEAVGHPTDKIELLILGGTLQLLPP